MITNFILSIASKVFKGYLYGVSYLSICIVLLTMSAIKFLLSYFESEFLRHPHVQGFFQLSIFFFIPLFLFLVYIGYKKDSTPISLSFLTSIIFFTTITLLLVLLFTYLLLF